jgi:DNA repair exonuclease SbcCD nuclease subunit
VKIAITADVHIHNYTEFNEVDSKGRGSRLIRVTDCLLEMAEISKSQGVEIFIIAGDLFHSRKGIPPNVLHHTAKVIAKLNSMFTSVVCLAGNHDMSATGDGTMSITALSGLMSVVSNSKDYLHAGTSKIGFLPYVEDPMEARIAVREMVGKCDYLIAHVGLDQALAGPTDYEIPGRITLNDLMVDKFKKVYLGHYHKAQQVGPNAWYVGSPLQHSFGERNDDKGFYILDTRDNSHMFINNTWSSKFVQKVINDRESEEEAKQSSKNHFVEMRYVEGFQPTINSDSRTTRVRIDTIVEEKKRIDFGQGTDIEIVDSWIEYKNPEIKDLRKLKALGLEMLQQAKAEVEV